MVVRKIFLTFLIVLVCIPFVLCESGRPIRLFSNDGLFSLGDNVKIFAQISNNHDFRVRGRIESLMVNEGDTLSKGVEVFEIDLQSYEKKNFSLYDFWVDENFDKGMYVVTSELFYGNQKVFNDRIIFEVEEILENLIFDLMVCGDINCDKEKILFIKNEDVFLNFESPVENILIEAILIYPDKSRKEIDLPTSIKEEQIGTYEIEVSASKEGYKTIEKKMQFGVIEKHVEIQFSEGGGGNGDVGGVEEARSSDAEKREQVEGKTDSMSSLIWWIVGAGVLVLLVSVGFMIRIIKKKR